MSLAERHTKALRKKARYGFRGYPVATVAYYGPDARQATKVAVAVIPEEGAEPAALERWFNEQRDVRRDHDINGAILRFIRAHGVHSVAMSGDIIGCPHEEGIDYPDGGVCPQCPYWADCDRWEAFDGATGGAADAGMQPVDVSQAPCPCGSGKSFGECCGATGAAREDSVAARTNRELAAVLEGQDFASIEAAQAFVDRHMAERNRRAVDEFAGLSPAQMSALLYTPFDSPPLATLEQRLPATIDVPLLALFRIIADAAREKGIKLTARGNLPLKLVKTAAAWLRTLENAPRTRFGGISTESDVEDFHCARITAELVGLLRKSRGYLYLTRRAEKMLDTGNDPALYRRLFEVWAMKFNWAYRDGYGDLRIIQQGFGFTLHLFRQYGDAWRPINFYEDAFLRASPMVLDQADDGLGHMPPERRARSAWSSRTLEGFGFLLGLVELAADDGRPPWIIFNDNVQARATPLLSAVFPEPPTDAIPSRG